MSETSGGPTRRDPEVPVTDGSVTDVPDLADVEVLGLAGAALLTHFESLAADARNGEVVADTLELARHASAQFVTLDRVLAGLTDAGVTADAALSGYVEALTQFHRHVQPRTWPETLLKVVLVTGFAQDLDSLCAEHLSPRLRARFSSLVAEGGALSWWASESLKAQIEADAEVTSTLGLFGRRVLAEATAQAQRVAAQHPGLASQLTASEPGSVVELHATVQLIADLVEASAQRMVALGLQP